MFEASLGLISTVLAAISLILVGYLSFRSLGSMKRFENLIPDFDDYVKLNEDGTVTMDARLVGIIDGVGSRLFQSAKMSMLQGLSVNSKLDKGLKGAIAKDVIEDKLPLLQAAGDFMGFNTKEYVAKNPDALFQLMNIPVVQKAIAGFMGNNGAQGPSQSRSRM